LIAPPASLPNQEYTVTTTYADFGPGTWAIVPSYCPFDFEVVCTPIVPVANAPDTAITFNDDTDTFSVDYQNEVDPITQTQTCTVKAVSFSVYKNLVDTVTLEEQETFDLSFKDPCSDASVVTLKDPGQISPPDDFKYDGMTQTFTYDDFIASPNWCEI